MDRLLGARSVSKFGNVKGSDALFQDTEISQAYSRFLDTHVDAGITDDLLYEVPLDELPRLVEADINGFQLSSASRQALADHLTSIQNFAIRAGIDEILLTQGGTWVVPPKLRDSIPEYKKYLNANYDEAVVGTAAITLAQNQPIPVFEDGEQIGGFESGDDHGFLTIVDRRDGSVYELHQTFLENSDDPAYRPEIVNVNEAKARDLGLSQQEALDLIKSPDTKLESVGMLDGRYTELTAYACELTPDIDRAMNWNGGVPGSNFNYIPMAAIEMKLTTQQLDLLLFDRELSSRECAFKPAEGCEIRDQNAEGFEPMMKEGVYPDGSPRYVMSSQENKDGEIEVVFRNASGDEAVPEGSQLHRVKEYVTVVDPKDMQVVEPYNHWGNSRSEQFKASNCFGTCMALLDGVAAAGEKDDMRAALGIKKTSSSGIMRMVAGLVTPQIFRRDEFEVDGALEGDVGVYKAKNGSAIIYDFIDLPETMKKSLRRLSFSDIQGPAGNALEKIQEQRRQAVEQLQRPSEENLTLMPVGSIGHYLKQAHETLYGVAPNAQDRELDLHKAYEQ